MEKEFVPYELSVKLKALGFDKPCFGFYELEYGEIRPIMVDDDEQYRLTGYRTCKNSEIPKHYTSAPTFSQAFRWFREKQAIEGFIHKAIEGTYYFVIKRLGNNESNMYEFITNAPKNVDTFEEAELACLDKLIEIVETK